MNNKNKQKMKIPIFMIIFLLHLLYSFTHFLQIIIKQTEIHKNSFFRIPKARIPFHSQYNANSDPSAPSALDSIGCALIIFWVYHL